MPKIVEIKGKKSPPKVGTANSDDAMPAAEIIIFPGVRYERTDEDTATDVAHAAP